ncbi:MAG TPA: pantoate--beta-alanine ligase [Mycobacteriales bacterium]
MTVVVHTRAELAQALRDLADVRLVPTMGALHAGHAALIDAAGPGAVVSVFVNPLQFGAGEDYGRYPRTLETDVALCEAHDVAVVWAPSVRDMYVGGQPAVTVRAGELGARLEGAARPGHFDGVLTVVAKLFGATRADVAYFGQKDAQQLALVRRMVTDLDLPTRVVEVPTVREPDGLALSSRNRYLSAAERTAALALSRAVRAGSLDAARAALADAAGLDVDYCELVDSDTFAPRSAPPGRLVVAARVGTTRLLDNELVTADVRVPELV